VKGDFYQLNSYMLNLIVSTFCPLSIEHFENRQLSLLLEGECDVVRERIKLDFEEYVDSTYLALKTPQKDSESFLLRLMNDSVIENLDLRTKAKIVKKQLTKFSQIDHINDKDLWSNLLGLGRVLPTWENIIRYFYYRELVIDDTLLSCFSDPEFVEELCKNKMQVKKFDNLEDDFDGITGRLINAIVDKDSIPDVQYRFLMKSILFSLPNSRSFNQLSLDKIKILIDENKLFVSIETLENLIESKTDLAINFVKANFDIVVSNASEGDLEITDISFIRALLISDDLTDSQKRQLVYSTSESVLEEFEIGVEVAQIFVNILQGDIEKLDFNFTEKLMQSEAVTLDNKLSILANQIKFINDHNEFHQLLRHLGDGYEEIFTKGSSYVEIADTAASRHFVDKCRSSGQDWIGTVKYKDGTTNNWIHVYVRKWRKNDE
jgi:hypothetical protein